MDRNFEVIVDKTVSNGQDQRMVRRCKVWCLVEQTYKSGRIVGQCQKNLKKINCYKAKRIQPFLVFYRFEQFLLGICFFTKHHFSTNKQANMTTIAEQHQEEDNIPTITFDAQEEENHLHSIGIPTATTTTATPTKPLKKKQKRKLAEQAAKNSVEQRWEGKPAPAVAEKDKAELIEQKK
jgi:REP element-mobilizing transposase RayT